MLTQEQLSILDLADRTGMIRVGDDKICPGITFAKKGPRDAICEGHPRWADRFPANYVPDELWE